MFVILGETVEKAQSYAQILHLPFPVLADPDRAVYQNFGLEKVFFVLQRTASVIIDCEGIIRYLKTASNPMTCLAESRELLDQAQILSKPG